MIDVDYNEYKKTIAENMKSIVENHRLEEVEKEHQKLNGELRVENERLKLHIMKIKEAISTWNIENDEGHNDFKIPNKIIDIVWSDD